ncbi:hypothetical protein GDO86_012333 [Hymenochirus boettgeri]|uniref:Bcl-2-like protein 12 n=1 Tax=Hymenochirus boettgeri TaxID=247094 RepID=A0A8T2IPL6_9PIPI|nr:hypothetical protein GDO86_012333 [Hymenochirus boettgeri]
METTVKHTTDDGLFKVKEETKHVLEAFLKRSLNQSEATSLGHIGRTYHDPKKYSHSRDEGKQVSTNKLSKSEKKKKKESGREIEDRRHSPTTFGGAFGQDNVEKCNSLHEVNRVEESKHGFKTGINKLLRRQSQSKEKDAKEREANMRSKNGNVHSKSLENVLDETPKDSNKWNSIKRPKSPNPLLACTVAGSVESLTLSSNTKKPVEFPDKDSSHGGQKKPSRSFKLRNILKKKSKDHISDIDVPQSRPTTLPVEPCYDKEDQRTRAREIGKPTEKEIYNLAAKKLDKLVKQKKLKSPVENRAPPFPQPSKESGITAQATENNNVAESAISDTEDKEQLIHRLVELLQEQATDINNTINQDPFLRNTLSTMSYRSFSRLAEFFTSQAEVEADEAGGHVSPELTKIALTMELTRKVAGISSHAVHQLMGYSMQYMDMFVPWLQRQGGWEKIVTQDGFPDMQID